MDKQVPTYGLLSLVNLLSFLTGGPLYRSVTYGNRAQRHRVRYEAKLRRQTYRRERERQARYNK